VSRAGDKRFRLFIGVSFKWWKLSSKRHKDMIFLIKLTFSPDFHLVLHNYTYIQVLSTYLDKYALKNFTEKKEEPVKYCVAIYRPHPQKTLQIAILLNPPPGPPLLFVQFHQKYIQKHMKCDL